MTTTFDRYLLTRYLQVFAILFVSVFGLFVVIDGFSNVDEFQADSSGALDVFTRMASFYAFQSSFLFDKTGPLLTVIGAMIVFALLLRNLELHPILAAGVPTRRLLLPVAIGAAFINGLMALNQELIIPRIAYALQAPRGAIEKGKIFVEPMTDHLTDIYIDGKGLSLKNQRIQEARFVLPPTVATRITTLQSEEAAYFAHKPNQPAGWLLKNVRTPFADLTLTSEGRKHVLPLENPKDVFIVSEVSFDQLYNRLQSFTLLPTSELIRRFRSPAYGRAATPGLALHLHSRIVRPFANLIAVFVAVPLIVRKESRGLVGNMAICTAVMATLLGFAQMAAYFGMAGALTPQMAAWLPILGSGTLAAWLTGVMQT